MKDEIVQTLQELVRIPSLVGQEGTAQAYMDRLYRSLNLEVSIPPPRSREGEEPIRLSSIRRCLTRDGPMSSATLAGAGSGPSLILNGHVDVVSPEPVSGLEV